MSAASEFLAQAEALGLTLSKSDREKLAAKIAEEQREAVVEILDAKTVPDADSSAWVERLISLAADVATDFVATPSSQQRTGKPIVKRMVAIDTPHGSFRVELKSEK